MTTGRGLEPGVDDEEVPGGQQRLGPTIEATGPHFGSDALLDIIADTPDLATFMSVACAR